VSFGPVPSGEGGHPASFCPSETRGRVLLRDKGRLLYYFCIERRSAPDGPADYEAWVMPAGDYSFGRLSGNFFLLTTNALNMARD
jgi:hypothetical protein